ncbi:MAG TPA: protein kinase [Pyrinomonadaceae bacterium]|nr:protein kinase [Pyrinomonadaceae bacterium]
MQTNSWEKVKNLLDQVLELEISQRQDFLANCGESAEVRAEVESLISFENEAENLMNLSAVEFSKDFFAEEENPNSLIGQNIGVYRIIRELGLGGMGAVYLAERNDGKFEQKVALKLLKREVNTSAIRRRFQLEREILASLEHPNIARLLDAGTTDDKAPFLAMEYVEGVPIDEYCQQHNLDLHERLALFQQVCSAVNFAHRNLVVHRDLKPSNILVTEDGIPKLLDFGISKILSKEFESAKSATVTRLGAMTPSYASPEQIQQKSVTTATDIHSLGVILYELLSGHRPFETKEDSLKDIFQAVVETEPLPPSAMVEKLAKLEQPQIVERSATPNKEIHELSTLLGNHQDNKTERFRVRHTTPKLVYLSSGSLRGDLDNIVLKALSKEPERRYLSAENFAEDIRRYEQGLPILARPNTLAYRAEKFFKRNRLTVIAGTLILIAIIGGIVATLWQSRIARAERAKAERRFGDVRKLANSYLFDIFPEIEDLEGSLKAREKILKTALEYLDSLSQEAEGDSELQLELATAYEKIGEVQGAVNIQNLGNINAGLQSYEKARKLREAVFAVNSADLKNKEALSKNYQITAQTLMWNVDTAKAAENFEKAIKLRRELVAEKPESPDYQNRLAVILTDYAGILITNVENEKAAKLLDESAAIIKATLKTNPEHLNTRKAYPRILRAYSHLKSNTGDYEGAIKDLDESVVLTNELIKQKSDDYSLRRTSFLNDFGYCEVYAAKRDGQKIVETCLKTVDFNLKALEKEPDESFALYDLAMSYYNIAQGYRLSNDPKRAIEYAEKALAPLSKLNKLSPGVNDYVRGVAVVENELADALLLTDKTDDALKYLNDAQINLEKVVETDKTVISYQTELAKVYRSSAAAFSKKGDKTKAVEFIDKTISVIQKLKNMNALRDSDKNLLTELEKEKAEFSK